jgi:hypothetical protein
LLSVLVVLALPGPALARDRDHDALPDRWERRHHLSTSHGSANKDPDGDRVDNGNEYRERTDPRDRDSDGDGRRDGREDPDRDRLSNAAEDATGNDPRDRDTDDDGVVDGRERAGVVLSYFGGVLTIDLANGGSVTGYVTEDTEIECSSERQAERRHRGRGRGRAHKAQLYEDEDGFLEPGDDEPPYPDEGEEEDEPGYGEEWPEEDDDLGDDVDKDFEDDDSSKEGSCSSSSLDRGVGVHEAKLKLTADGLVFKSLALVR